ncbi:MAG TPA: hypothetical protein VI758_00685, partial [Bacteroidota bacterium]
MTSSHYIPGECNIGQAEIDLRRRLGWIGLTLTIVLWFFLNYVRAAPFWFFLILAPSTLCAVGFIQAKMRFCAAFGLRNLFNFGSEVGKTDTVLQAEFRTKDRSTALKILGVSFFVG